MKFMPGYKITDNDDFVNEIIAQKEHIYEVYFSWGDMPNGRNPQTTTAAFLPWEAQARQINDLAQLSENGLKLNLLLNGNCYGDDTLAKSFYTTIGNTIDYIGNQFGLSSVTTTSPIIAKFIKSNFESIKVRASVNMKIGTIEGMDYIAEYFDEYYMQREYNRDFDKIRELHDWCEKNGKGLFILANSGCLNNCSAQIFHDNLVSHEGGAAKRDNAYTFIGMCHEYLKSERHYNSLITHTNFIRPEDIHLYDAYFTAAKLATRVSKNPARTLKSYINGRYSGNILELLEPAHSIFPYVLENGNPLKLVRLVDEI